jgi:predicted ester cyclase
MLARSSVVAGALIAGGLLCACSSPEPAPPAQPAAPTAITAEERVKWYQDCWGFFNDKKWDEFKGCYSDTSSLHQYGAAPPSAQGAAAIVAAAQDFKKSFPDARGDAQLILANGTHVAGTFVLQGTNTGPLTSPEGKDMPPTGKAFGVLFGHIIEADPTAPKVVREVGVMDGATAAAQLGLSKPAGRSCSPSRAPRRS